MSKSIRKRSILRQQARQLAEEVRRWISTPEGVRRIQEAAERAVEATEDLERARAVDPAKLSEPFTV